MRRAREVTKEVLGTVARIRAGGATSVQVDAAHAQLLAMVQRAMQRAGELGLSQRDANDVGYVLAALVDETMLASEGPVRNAWAGRMLQLVLFQENVAGEEVFRRLDALLADTTRTDVLEVYYLALLHGFRGRYGVRGGETELERVVAHAASVLGSRGVIRESALSPNAARPGDAAGRRGLRFSAMHVAIGSVALAIVGYAALAIHSRAATDGLVERLEAIQSQETRR